jgi:hypothetical protein
MQVRQDRVGIELAARLQDERERRERGSRQLWAMTAAQREAAMWRGELTFAQLREWYARAPQEVPLLGGELPWIAVLTPEWAEADE